MKKFFAFFIGILISISAFSQDEDARKNEAASWFKKGNEAYCAGNKEEAVRCYQNMTDMGYTSKCLYGNWGNALACLAVEKKDSSFFEESIVKHKRAIKVAPNEAVNYNNYAYAINEYAKLKGDVKPTGDFVKELCLKAEELQEGAGAYNLACIHSLLGEKEEALYWFEKSFSSKYPVSRMHIETDCDLNNIRNNVKFKQLLNHYYPIDILF